MAKKQMTVAELTAEVERLTALVHRMAGVPFDETEDVGERDDYVEFGSPRHVALLGLRPVEDDEENDLIETGVDGTRYTLIDRTLFGVAVRHEFLEAILKQKVNQLVGPPQPQSLDPRAPNYAPPMWRPTQQPATGITV